MRIFLLVEKQTLPKLSSLSIARGNRPVLFFLVNLTTDASTFEKYEQKPGQIKLETMQLQGLLCTFGEGIKEDPGMLNSISGAHMA